MYIHMYARTNSRCVRADRRSNTSFVNHRDAIEENYASLIVGLDYTSDNEFDYLHLTYRSMVAVAGSPTSLFATQVYRPASAGLSAWNRRRDLSYKNGISPSCQWDKYFHCF